MGSNRLAGLFSIIMLAAPRLLFAQPMCYNGSPQNLTLYDQFIRSQVQFLNQDKTDQKTPTQFVDFFHIYMVQNKAKQYSPNAPSAALSEPKNNPSIISRPRIVIQEILDRCGFKNSTQGLFELKKLKLAAEQINQATPFPKIKKACIMASLKRQNSTQGYYCQTPDSKPKPIGSPGTEGPCISEEMVNYVTWAVNSAIECQSTRENPIDPLVVLKKMNNETGFSFFQASTGGVGIGQLTTSAIKEVNRNLTDTLSQVRESKNPACQPFQTLLNQKTKPEDATKWCSLLHFSQGLGNNLLYSIGYFIHSRDNLMGRFQRQVDKCGIERADVKDTGALAAYGPLGLDVQGKLISILKNTCDDPDAFIKKATKDIQYLKQTDQKLNEVLSLADYGIKKIEDCIE